MALEAYLVVSDDKISMNTPKNCSKRTIEFTFSSFARSVSSNHYLSGLIKSSTAAPSFKIEVGSHIKFKDR